MKKRLIFRSHLGFEHSLYTRMAKLAIPSALSRTVRHLPALFSVW